MTCAEVRAALSALLDGEGTLSDGAGTHLAGCTGCQAWKVRAERVTTAFRAVPVPAAPDLTERILTAAAADRAVAANARRQILRVTVGAAAVVQLLLALPLLLDGGAGPHASREMASFDIALAVGFLLAAVRPQQARAFLPVAGVLAACLALTSGIDVLNYSTALVHETGHLVALAQAGLLWALGRTNRPPAAAAVTVNP